MCEVTADAPASRHGEVSSEHDGRDETASHRGLPVDLALQQLDQDRCALRVADEHDAATVVEVRDVIAEGGKHAVVGDDRVRMSDAVRVLERAQRDLPVDRRIDAADLREPRGLCSGNLALPEPDREIRVDRRLTADRRVT